MEAVVIKNMKKVSKNNLQLT